MMAAALQMGPRLGCVASPGAHLALSGAPPPLVTEGGSGAFALLQRGETDRGGRDEVGRSGTKWDAWVVFWFFDLPCLFGYLMLFVYYLKLTDLAVAIFIWTRSYFFHSLHPHKIYNS